MKSLITTGTGSGNISDRLSWTLDFPARNFSDNIDFVLNADFTGGLEGTKEPQTHWRTTDIGAFDTGSSHYVARNECEGIADFAPCFIPDAHRLLFSGTKLSSLSVSIFQSRRVMSASRRQARGRINGEVLPGLVRVSVTEILEVYTVEWMVCAVSTRLLHIRARTSLKSFPYREKWTEKDQGRSTRPTLMGMEERGHDGQVATKRTRTSRKGGKNPIAFPGHEASETASTSERLYRSCRTRIIPYTPLARPLYPVPIHLQPQCPLDDVAELRRVIALMNDRMFPPSSSFICPSWPSPRVGALISRPRLPFIFSLVFSPSPFRTISSGTCPPEVPRTTTTTTSTTVTSNGGTTSTRDSFAKFDLLSHLSQPFFFGYSPRGWAKGQTAHADEAIPSAQEEARKADNHLYFLGGLVGVWRLSGGKPTHQLVMRSYGSNAGHIHHRDISSNYADNLTLLSNDEPPRRLTS
ncbi:hypothetical protein DBV15_07160 [Temnothorax longispinosus]|uniref:Uncharacterized protein n=1 Tax=Temnothorax longispinosus TaxID=300112 RepID=A0A4S2KK66_9HYME|nr:hypothetical protein DBV15_07160 [Temnothorax longispinosus]